ncbi:MAG: diacylglycerol kinase (ATP) [Planctomycetota bacterium]
MEPSDPKNPSPSTEDSPTFEGPLSFGLISGPGYHNKKGGLDRLMKVLEQHPEISHHIVSSPLEVAKAVDELLASSTGLIGVNGGDGTLGMVVTDLIRRGDMDNMPLLAALAGGRTNMSHGDLGLKGEPHKAIRRLIKWAADPSGESTFVSRTALKLKTKPDDSPLYGFFVGAAAIYRASRVIWENRDATKLPGMKTVLGTAVHVSSLLTRILVGKKPFASTTIEVSIDDEVIEEKEFTVLFVTTLDRMALGFKPFWGKSLAPLRLTTIAHSHRHFLRAALAGVRGKTNKYLTREHGFESHTGWKITLGINEPVTLDGEVITPQDDSRIVIEAGPKLTFVQV